MVAHSFIPSIQETEAGESLWIQGLLGLYHEFQDNQGCYRDKPYLKNNQANKQKKKNLIF